MGKRKDMRYKDNMRNFVIGVIGICVILLMMLII